MDTQTLPPVRTGAEPVWRVVVLAVVGWFVVSATVLVLAGWALVSVLPPTFPFPAPAPEISDPRACPGSNLELDEALATWGLVIPESATDLRFDSQVHPWFGERNLVATFALPADDVDAMITDSDLSPTDEGPVGVAGAGCLTYVDEPERVAEDDAGQVTLEVGRAVDGEVRVELAAFQY